MTVESGVGAISAKMALEFLHQGGPVRGEREHQK